MNQPHHETGLSHLMHEVRTAELPAKVRCRHALGVAAETMSAAGAFPETTLPVLRPADRCPRCGGAMDEAAPHPGERDTNIPAFSGGHECTDCGLEVEEEDTLDDHDRARAARGEGF